MYQIDDSTVSSTQPASTALGAVGFFTDGNAATGVPATVLPAEFLNSVMLEIVNAITGAGIALSKSTFNQLFTAIETLGQGGASSYAVDTGVANAYAVAFAPAITMVADGFTFRMKVGAANTGASTVAINGLAAIPILGGAHSALQGGELVANGDALLMYNSSLASCVLLESSGGAAQVGLATKSKHALQLGQATGRYLGTQTITSTGTYTPGTYNGITATKAHMRGVAPGGGSGGCIATSTGQAAGSAAGSAGNPFDFWIVSGLAPMSITVGAAGAAGAAGANNGGNGGNLVIGSVATIIGGRGGSAGNASGTFPSLTNACFSNPASTIASSGGMTLAGIINGIGQTGVRGVLLTSGTILYSAGGNTAFGSGGTVDQAPALGYGSGAVGNGIGASTAATPGFPGAPAILVIDEYI